MRPSFFKMFKDGLIYRGKRLVNWDTQLQTSVADDETFDETIKGGFWILDEAVLLQDVQGRPHLPRQALGELGHTASDLSGRRRDVRRDDQGRLLDLR